MPSPRLSDSGSSVNNRSSVSAAHADEFYMRSLLGAQAESRHETAPRYGFGTGQRAAYDIMYGGPGTDKGRPCRLSPGPIYMPGAGPDSWRGPKFSFGTGPPAGSCGASANKGSAQQPGPGDYELSDAVGPQYSSLARNAPKFTWGSMVRDTGGVKVHGLPARHARSHAHAAGFLTATASTPPARHAPAAKARARRTADIHSTHPAHPALSRAAHPAQRAQLPPRLCRRRRERAARPTSCERASDRRQTRRRGTSPTMHSAPRNASGGTSCVAARPRLAQAHTPCPSRSRRSRSALGARPVHGTAMLTLLDPTYCAHLTALTTRHCHPSGVDQEEHACLRLRHLH